MKTKVECGKQLFPHCCIVCRGPLAMWPSHILPLSPSPFTLSSCHCHHLPPVFSASYISFFFFFSPFILNLCRTMSTVISLSPPPLLSCTQAITRHRHHQPLSLPHQHSATSSIP